MAKKEKDQGMLIGHFACTLSSDCHSSDAMAVYSHKDGSNSAYCWSCNNSAVNYDLDGQEPVLAVKEKSPEQLQKEREMFEMVKDDLEAHSMKSRKMKAEVYDFYGVKMDTEEDGETIRAVYYPTYRDGEHTGYRMRTRIEPWERAAKKNPKKIGVLKSFKGGLLDTKKGIQMFGQNKFEAGGRMLIISMGEEDAIATYHMTSLCTKFEGGYPSIAPPSGENLAFVRENYDYIKSFEKIVIIPDKDEPGQKFKNDLCKLLPIGKTYVVDLPEEYKDPSEMWTSAKSSGARTRVAKKLYNMIWNAERYSPAGIKSMSEGWDSYVNRGKDILIPFPESFGELNSLTHGGYALGEIVTLTAPSSVGKSIFIKEMLYTALNCSPYKIGVISLEETLDEFIEGFLSIHMSEQLNEIPYDERDRKREWVEFKNLLKIGVDQDDEERVYFLDHQGACDDDELLDKADFLINGLGCQIIVLDPATLAVSGSESNEDEFCSEVLKKVKRGDKVAWLNVCHVRKSGGGSKANSEGGELAEEDMKGSGVWFQTSMINIILTRNKVHKCPLIRNTTTIKLSKCRRHGKNTGYAGWVYYNGETGRLEKGQDPAELEQLDFEDEFEEEIPDKPLNSFGGSEKSGGKVGSGDEWA